MERNKNLPPITLFIVFLLLNAPKITESQFRATPIPARPLCLSQFALANHACSLLPYNPNPYEPPPPSDEPDDPDELLHVDSDHHDNGHGNGNGNGQNRHHHHARRHRHRRNHRHHETPIEEECCRWLKAVDDQCVCEVLVHLPVFMARPWHRFQVVVDESCNVTYPCSGRMIGV